VALGLHKTANLLDRSGKHHLADSDFRQINAQVLGSVIRINMVTREETFHVETLLPNAKFLELKDTLHH
jgi:hypothetical protein